MANIVQIVNPLMQPVQYHGQTYFTGQYFHQMYRANSDADGKYKQFQHFTRLIRSIEAYPLYIESGDIVELTKADADAALASGEAGPEMGPAFKATFGKPIMLINATAQVALTHHLDDEVSKQASVAINRQVARASDPLALKYRQAKTIASCSMSIFKMLGADVPMARTLTVERVKEEIGMDFSKVLASNSVEEAPMTPTDLGKEIGISGRKMNAALEQDGFQERDDHDEWRPTEKGKPYCTVNPYKSPNSDHVGYRVLWYRRVLDVLTKEDAA